MRRLIAVMIALLLCTGTALAQTPTPYPTPTPRPTPDLSIDFPYPPHPSAPFPLPDISFPTPAPVPTLQPVPVLDLPAWTGLDNPIFPSTATLPIRHTDDISSTIQEIYNGWMTGPASDTLVFSRTVFRRFDDPPEMEVVTGTTSEEAVEDMNEGMMVTMDYFRALIDIQVVGPMLIAMVLGFGWMLFVNILHYALKAIIVAIDMIIFLIRLLSEVLPGF